MGISFRALLRRRKLKTMQTVKISVGQSLVKPSVSFRVEAKPISNSPASTSKAHDMGSHLSQKAAGRRSLISRRCACLLYTSDAADDLLCVDLGGRRIIK